MTAKRVASAYKPKSTIASALDADLVERAQKLASLLNRGYPTEEQQTVESVLWIAVNTGLDAMEWHYRKEPAHV